MPRSSTNITAFQGELGAFSHAAALKLLGKDTRLLPCSTFREVFQALESGRAAQSVIPIENTLYGSVHENYDLLMDFDFMISGETSIRISHQLIAMPGISLRKVRQVFSHPVALNQCKEFFLQNPALEQIPFYDTAGSVKHLKETAREDAAAIASETAARTYGGVILKRNIEDIPQNFTRFFLLTKQRRSGPRSVKAHWKTSVVFATANAPGALFRALACFALRDLSLTKIESRPLRGKPWEYLFYVDLVGSEGDQTVQSALSNLKECSHFVKLLGSYRPTP